MQFSVSFLALSLLSIVAAHENVLIPRALQVRQSSQCYSSEKVCGDGCIDLTDTCCPDGSGGCPIGQYCTLGDNGEYGCCRNGRTCSGDGGAITSYDYTSYTNTYTRTYSSYRNTYTNTDTYTYTSRYTTARPTTTANTDDDDFGATTSRTTVAPSTVATGNAVVTGATGVGAKVYHAHADLLLLGGTAAALTLSLFAAIML